MSWNPPTKATYHRVLIVSLALAIFTTACSSATVPTEAAGAALQNDDEIAKSLVEPAVETSTTTTSTTSTTTTTTPPTTTTSTAPPVTAPLPLNLSEAELVDRRLATRDFLTPPVDEAFVSTIQSPAPREIIARSTWREECPVPADQLSYAQVSFYGFDGEFHTGEMLIHEDYAAPVVDIFERLHEIRFPIEEMRVVSQAELDTVPTEDTNNTSVYTCRRTVSGSRWSRHAFGDAVDINPFHNPYVSNSRVIPSLATAYVDREREVPGIITEEISAMFAEIGWGWGGDWNSVKDWMHFSATGI